MTPQDLSAKIAADLGLPEASERTTQQCAILALMMEALYYRNPPIGPKYERILAWGHAAIKPATPATPAAPAPVRRRMYLGQP